MILIPTRGRPLNLQRLATHYAITGATEPVCVLLDEDDAPNYEGVERRPGWEFRVHGPRTHITEITNRGFAMYPDEESYGVLADDVIPRTFHWDQVLKAAAGRDGIAWGNDLLQGERLPTHIFMGGDLARALGWVSCPRVKHWCADNVWLNIGQAMGTARYLPEVILEHAHHINGKAEEDATYREQPDHQGDVIAYKHFHFSGEFARLMAEVKARLHRGAA